MNKQWKMKGINRKDISVPIIADGLIASAGVANGRNIPVVIVESDSKNIIDSIILAHKNISYGHCDSQWGIMMDKKAIVLFLEFKDPIASKIIITFDIVKFGIVVNQIIYAQCMYLMTGKAETKLSKNLDKEKVLLEIPAEDFADEWNRIYRKAYTKNIKKKHHISQEEAEEIFDKMQKEFESIKTLRMK